ncbi:MAG: TRAP transporter small permease [Alkalispirochaeta sp.]|jgi:TRAP-type mannitol/chloroaromatic compound transport system permease small subunit
MKKIMARVNQFSAELSGWLLVVIIVLLVLNLVLRFFGIDVEALLQLTTFVFLAVVYLGLAHSEEQDDHIKVSVIIENVPKPIRTFLNFFNYVMAVIFGAILTYAAFDAAREAFIYKETLPGINPLPTFPVKIVIFLGLLFFTFQVIVQLIALTKHKNKGEI